MLAGLLDAVGEPARRQPLGDPYGALVRAVVGQQLSVSAARSIYERLLAFFGGSRPSPRQLLDADPEAMRIAAGLSRAKVAFVRSLAEHVLTGELELDRIGALDDSELIAELTAVKGIGTWTAHMFMMFELGREDILASGDLGVRRAVERAYRLPEIPAPAALELLAEPWRPHRSAACLLLWHSLSATPGP